MSFLNRQRRPLQRQATIAEAENISIHARLSSPSRNGSVESLVNPSAKQRKPTLFNPFRPKRAPSLFSNPLAASSQVSVSTLDGRFSELDDETSSTPTLNSIPDGLTPSNTSPAPASSSAAFLSGDLKSSPKASQNSIHTPPEDEWMNGEKGSSKEEVLVNKSGANNSEANSPPADRNSKPLPVMMNEQANAQLADELATVQKKLTLLMEEQTHLQEKVRFLEEENKAGTLRISQMRDAAQDEKVELLRTHSVETSGLRDEIRSLREDIRSMTRGSLDRDERLDGLNREILQIRTRTQEFANEIKAVEQAGLQKERLLVEANNMERESMRQEIRTLQQSYQSLMHQVHDKEEVTQLRNEISEVRNRLKENEENDESKFGKLQEELHSTDAAVRVIRESEEKIGTEVQALKGRMNIDGGTIQQLQQQIDTMAKEATAEKEKRLEEFKQSRHEVDDLRQQLTRRETELETYRKEVGLLSKTVNGPIQEHLDGLEKTSETLEKNMERARSQAEEYPKELEKLKGVQHDAVTEANRKFKSLEDQISSNDSVVRDLKSDFGAKHEELDTTTKSVDELRKEVASLKGEFVQLKHWLEQKHEAQENQASIVRRGQGSSILMNSLRTLPSFLRSLKSKETPTVLPV